MWLAGGLALVVAELATPSGFFIIFFGIGALAVGALAALGVVTVRAARSCCCSRAVGRVLLAFLRGRLQRLLQTPPSSSVDSLVGVLAMVQERMSPGVVGRVEVRGSMWAARNTSDVTLDPGQRARVAAVDGLTLASFPNRSSGESPNAENRKLRRSA